jgi:NAD(P)-dependent dehydrogenase (short-subunit alcohol dehydrogenase family)
MMLNRDAILEVLQAWADDPSLIDDDPRAKTLIAKIHREGSRGVRNRERQARQERDREKIESRGRVVLQTHGPQALPHSTQESDLEQQIQLEKPRYCSLCRAQFSTLHPFYHSLCSNCAVQNWDKRNQRADLHGKIALVTGGRIKIGFELALKLLRDGARVLVTTRFPVDAKQRFEAQDDFAVWGHNLEIFGLDLRVVPDVETFCAHWNQTLPHLDIIVNNAAQTVRRPREFYAHLLQNEPSALPEATALVLQQSQALATYFPNSKFDTDGQQIDMRPQNSWSARLGEVETLEAVENYLVNALAPFIISGKLRPLLQKSPASRKFIVCASAMEGNFSRQAKTVFHPQTNMGKAALNMMVRTSAADLALENIYLSAVDTGWITDENPFPKATRMRGNGFVPPLDSIDGASRLYDPIARGLNEPQTPQHGLFLKNYAPYDW